MIITGVRAAHRMAGPFSGSGAPGGSEPLSACAADIHRLVGGARPGTGPAHLAATLLAALTAVWRATTAVRRVLKWRQP
ncbi:hypothetical protein ACIRPX_00740 [Streptomyces sp. NPDC101225]|uniref:hypothetical protein n=1 Tax=Streptomyces sp. NPDC101225 TaxID=3366135 RepID=UPI0038221861